jgi:drug/metabolite transporter (DMT)-like permease
MQPESHNIRNDLMLLVAAAIWGFAFVAQRKGMEYIGPMLYNACRFGLGALSLVPLLIYSHRKKPGTNESVVIPPANRMTNGKRGGILLGGLCCGVVLFVASGFQQWGMVYTTAGKAGFITGLYVVLVPIINHLWGHKIGKGTWMGAIIAVIGLYFLSIKQDFSINLGDMLVLASALFWAIHITFVGIFSSRVGPIKLAFLQFAIASIFSLLAALGLEKITLSGIQGAMWPILYGGFMSAGIAFTIQVVVQEKANPAHAAIIMSLETLFAALGGWMLLSEHLGIRDILGCILMLSGMLISQLTAILSSRRS